jgi:hypothetical protein
MSEDSFKDSRQTVARSFSIVCLIILLVGCSLLPGSPSNNQISSPTPEERFSMPSPGQEFKEICPADATFNTDFTGEWGVLVYYREDKKDEDVRVFRICGIDSSRYVIEAWGSCANTYRDSYPCSDHELYEAQVPKLYFDGTHKFDIVGTDAWGALRRGNLYLHISSESNILFVRVEEQP